MNQCLTIKEFSELSGIKTSTLRYWDEINLFSPLIRDPENNYRYYAPEQVLTVNFFTVLSSLGIPLKDIKGIDAARNPENIIKLIDAQAKLLDKEMKRLQECYSIIHTRREIINAGLKAKAGEIAVINLSEACFTFGPTRDLATDTNPFTFFIKFCNQAENLHINLNFPVCGYYHNFPSFLADSETPDLFVSLNPNGKHKRPAGQYLVGFYRSSFGKFDCMPPQMQAYARDHYLDCIGPVYTQYLHDEICTKNPAQYLVQISVAVQPQTLIN